MNESEKQFSFTRAASNTSGRAKNQIPISNSYQYFMRTIVDDRFCLRALMSATTRGYSWVWSFRKALWLNRQAISE